MLAARLLPLVCKGGRTAVCPLKFGTGALIAGVYTASVAPFSARQSF